MYTMIFGSKTEAPILKRAASEEDGILRLTSGITSVELNEETRLCAIKHQGLFGISTLYAPESLYNSLKGRTGIKLEIHISMETMMGSLGLMYQYTVREL